MTPIWSWTDLAIVMAILLLVAPAVGYAVFYALRWWHVR
jgi:hypothetical protein